MDDWFKYLEQLKQEGEIGLFELQFGRFIKEFETNPTKNLISCSILAVNDQLAGNICTDLSTLESSVLASKLKLRSLTLQALVEELQTFDSIGKPGEYKPFIFDDNKLYLHKYWVYENELTNWLKNKSLKKPQKLSGSSVEIINSLFSEQEDEVNLQKVATYLSLIKDFVIISGGPGTGKTFTVSKIISALKKQDKSVSIALAAPTGKAAERLSESLEINEYNFEASTIHKLLGARRNGEFKYTIKNKLSFDVVIIDEASMLDIRLWISLLRATKDSTKLILLGDKDQLASVEAGSVLGDVCSASDNGFSNATLKSIKRVEDAILESRSMNLINNNIVLLEKSYRTKSSSGILELGKAINEQNIDKVFEVINEFEQIDIQHPSVELLEVLIENYAKEIMSGDNGSQFLCSNLKGILGTRELNARIEKELKIKLRISSSDEWYTGRRILITKNDFSTGLKNGEIGTCYKNSKNEFYISFDSSDQVLVSQLQNYDLAYALTVHKSQGSEFGHVFLFLPEKINPVLTKELLYTAVTRAKESTLVVGNRGLISEVVLKQIKRASSIPSKITK